MKALALVRLRSPAGRILGGALVTALGIAIAATAPIAGTVPLARVTAQQTAGGVVVLAGWVIFAWSIHRFGRERD